MRFAAVIAACAAVLLAGCGGGPKFGSAGSVAQTMTELPEPTSADTMGTRTYRVAPLDKLKVEVYDLPNLSLDSVQVGADGVLKYPVAGDVAVAGMTPAEIEGALQQRLRQNFIRDPQVTVNLLQTTTQVVTVDGQVREPGQYPVIGGTTLIQTIARAKGLTETAKPSSVVVLRTVNGQKMAALYNLTAIRRGVYADPALYPNDIVMVDENVAQRYFRDAVTIFSTLSYPLVAILP